MIELRAFPLKDLEALLYRRLCRLIREVVAGQHLDDREANPVFRGDVLVGVQLLLGRFVLALWEEQRLEGYDKRVSMQPGKRGTQTTRRTVRLSFASRIHIFWPLLDRSMPSGVLPSSCISGMITYRSGLSFFRKYLRDLNACEGWRTVNERTSERANERTREWREGEGKNIGRRERTKQS